jgi:hypothetical protein
MLLLTHTSGLHHELGLPQSGIDSFDEDVPFPTFIGSDHPVDQMSDDVSHYRMQFLAQIALRRVSGTIHQSMLEGESWDLEALGQLLTT